MIKVGALTYAQLIKALRVGDSTLYELAEGVTCYRRPLWMRAA